MVKSFPFFNIKTKIKILGHGSLKIDVIYRIAKLQSWGHDGKLEI